MCSHTGAYVAFVRRSLRRLHLPARITWNAVYISTGGLKANAKKNICSTKLIRFFDDSPCVFFFVVLFVHLLVRCFNVIYVKMYAYGNSIHILP